MTYTGYQDITPGAHPFTEAEAVLETARHIEALTGRPVKHKALSTIAAAADRLAEARRASADLPAQAQAQLDTAAADFAAGRITAEELVATAATTAATLAGLDETRRLANRAVAPVNRAALSAAAAIGNAWLAPLKARAAALLEEANAVADQIGHQPQAPSVGVRRMGSPWSPTRDDLETNMTLRHQWERLGSLLSDLDEVHTIADTLRNAGLVASVPGRVYCEDYRWRDADRLDGNPAEVREFFLANRHVAQPGLYTAEELTEAGSPQVRQLGIDGYNAAVAAGAVEVV